MIDYLFIDPFNSSKSGVTQYIRCSAKYLRLKGLSVSIFSIKKCENIEIFRKRLAIFVSENIIKQIEAPESLASTLYVDHPCIHIRLHLSRQLGQYLQSLKIDERCIAEEQYVIDNADKISAPSSVTVKASWDIFNNLDKCIVYPNYIFRGDPSNFISQNEHDNRRLFFIGRGEPLKGINFISVFKHFQDKLICIGDEKLEAFLKKINSSAVFFNGGNRDIFNIIQPYDVVVVLSGFETWSMVAAESLVKNCFVVCWAHLGICEFLNNPFVKKIDYADEEKVIEEISNLLLNLTIVNNKKLIQDINEINVLFEKGLFNQEGIKPKYNVPYPKKLIINSLKRPFLNRFFAKVKKLIKSPRKFLTDSFFTKTNKGNK